MAITFTEAYADRFAGDIYAYPGYAVRYFGWLDYRVAQRLDAYAGTINDLSFRTITLGTPSGSVYARIRAVSDDSIIAESPDVYTASSMPHTSWPNITSSRPHTFTFGTAISTTNIRCCIEYSGGNSTNNLQILYSSTSLCAGTRSFYGTAGPWSDGVGPDLAVVVNETNPASNVIDGNEATYWEADAAQVGGLWLDSGSVQNWGGCLINWDSSSTTRPTSYALRLDGVAVYTGSSDPGAGWQTYSWNEASGRYLAILPSGYMAGATPTRVHDVIGIPFNQIQPGIKFAFGQNIFTASPTWTDVSADCIELNTKGGRQHELDRIEAGTAVLTLKNTSGNYWRNNTTGAYTPNVKPLTRIRISTTYATTSYDLFDGYTESFEPGWVEDRGGKTPIMTVQCVDLFKSFSRYHLITPTTGNPLFSSELSGTRVVNILNQIGFPTTSAVIGISTCQINVAALSPPTGGTNAMEHLRDVADAEGGVLYMRGDGYLVFEGSLDRQVGTHAVSQATFASSSMLYALPELVDDDTYIYNEARVVANPSTGVGVEQVYLASTALITEQGERDWVKTDTVLQNDADALDKAYITVNRYKQSSLRCQSLLVLPDASPSTLYPKVLGYNISDKITFQLNNTTNPASINQDYHIEGIEHEWAAKTNLWETKWQLWTVNQYRIFSPSHTGYVFTASTNYTNVHNAVEATASDGSSGVVNDGAFFNIGQRIGVGDIYRIDRGFASWDISTLSATTSVTTGELLVQIAVDVQVNTAFNLTLVSATTGVVANPLVSTDYGDILNLTSSYGSVSIATGTTSLTQGKWLTIPINSSGIASLNLAGTTAFVFRTNNDINSVSPGTSAVLQEYIQLNTTAKLALKIV